MDTKALNEIADKIEEQIDWLEKQITQLEDQVQPVEPDDAIGRLTRMDAIASRGVNQTTLHKCRQRLAKLQDCLRRLEGEDFGYCQRCDEPIPVARLLLVPEATMCVACAEKSN